MVPVNQVILGSDPLLGSSMIGNSIDEQLQLLEKYKQNLEAARQLKAVKPQEKFIWDDIDAEVEPMTDEQKNRLAQDEEYAGNYNILQQMVQAEILNLVKGRIESSPKGKEILEKQLKIVRKLKGKIISETNREMDIFNRFKEYSKTHPDTTYEEFIKEVM